MKELIKSDKVKLAVAIAMLLFSLGAIAVTLAIYGLLSIVVMVCLHILLIFAILSLSASAIAEIIKYQEKRNEEKTSIPSEVLQLKPNKRRQEILPSIKTMKK